MIPFLPVEHQCKIWHALDSWHLGNAITNTPPSIKWQFRTAHTTSRRLHQSTTKLERSGLKNYFGLAEPDCLLQESRWNPQGHLAFAFSTRFLGWTICLWKRKSTGTLSSLRKPFPSSKTKVRKFVSLTKVWELAATAWTNCYYF